MTRKPAPGLVTKSRKVKRRFELLEETASRADAFLERLAREAPELSLDLDAVVDDAVAAAVDRASRALDTRSARTGS